MKRLLIGGLAALSLCASALAADLPAKVPSPSAPVGVFDWTGFYVGAHGVGFYTDVTPQAIAAAKGKPDGWGGGAQVEFLYQIRGTQVVAGIVADFTVADVNGTLAGGLANLKADVDATIRAKLGYAGFYPGVLLYVTGGIEGLKEKAMVATLTSTQTVWGYAAGGGAQFWIPNTNLSLFAEYLRLFDATGTFGFGGAAISGRTDANQVRVGLNYRM